MKKNVKVFEIKAKATNGNDRTVKTIVSLDVTLADVCEQNNIPMMSIISTEVTAPMTLEQAKNYIFRRHAALILNPFTRIVKDKISVYSA